MSNRPSPADARTAGAVRVRQLWQDMAPDMIDCERLLRVVAIDATHAECVVEHDKHGLTSRKPPRLALRRFATSALRLVEDVVDEPDQAVYSRFLTAMAEMQGRSPSAVEYATVALAVHKELLAESAAAQD
ncbi:DUF6354 family protein [Streptomyces sp. NPDC092903]|uniref:DUF6354 family protein n=1 Tax=Streptomyces sp. NPDC092903 TaxID=3366017 RepID=UPI00381CCC28